MAGPSDEANVLVAWGSGDAGPMTGGPMNGESGRRLCTHLARIVRRETPVQSICDLGCGNGFLTAQLATFADRVVGVDASKVLLEVAAAHHRPANVEYRYGLFGRDLAADLARDPFDLVISADVIEHLYRPMTLIETAASILKPGGRFIVCTPYHGYLKNVAISALGHWDSHHSVAWDGGHIKFFSPPTLAALVERQFDVSGFEYYGRVRWFWKNMICIASKRGA